MPPWPLSSPISNTTVYRRMLRSRRYGPARGRRTTGPMAALDNSYMRRLKMKVYVCQDMVTAIP
jgi:hypothetical protein